MTKLNGPLIILFLLLCAGCGGDSQEETEFPEFEPPDFNACICDKYSCWGDCDNDYPHYPEPPRSM